MYLNISIVTHLKCANFIGPDLTKVIEIVFISIIECFCDHSTAQCNYSA